MVQTVAFDGSVQDAGLAFDRFIKEYYDPLEFKPLDIRLQIRPQAANLQDRICVLSIYGNAPNSLMTVLARHTPRGTILEMDTTYDGAWYELAGAWEMLCQFLNDEGWLRTVSASEALSAEMDNGHYAHSPERRREIVKDYQRAREAGKITNKDAWARLNYGISGKTLLGYEKLMRRGT